MVSRWIQQVHDKQFFNSVLWNKVKASIYFFFAHCALYLLYYGCKYIFKIQIRFRDFNANLNFHTFKTEKKQVFVLSTKISTVPLLILLLKKKNEMIVSSKIYYLSTLTCCLITSTWGRDNSCWLFVSPVKEKKRTSNFGQVW